MGCDEWLCFGCMRVMVLGRLGGAVQLQTSRNMINFFRDACINGLRGDGWLKSAISGHREEFPEPAVRCDTNVLRARVVNPAGLTWVPTFR